MNKLTTFLKENRKWNTTLWILISVFLTVTLLSINQKENELRIKNIQVTIEPESELNFLDSTAVLNLLKKGDPEMMIIGQKSGNLRIDEMESDIESNPFVEEGDITVDLAGNMHVKILQRNPVLRVFNNKGQTYYVAKNGYKIPGNPNYTARVIVANGNIPESLTDSSFAKSKILNDLYRIALFCREDKFWDSQIEQLYVDNFNDILLIPMVGNHTIVFGSADDLEDKFERLKLFYFKGLNNIGWNRYKTINLKFSNQVVAEKFGGEQISPDTAR